LIVSVPFFSQKISAKFVPLRFKKQKKPTKNIITSRALYIHSIHWCLFISLQFFSIFPRLFLMQLYPSHFSTDKKIMQIYAKIRRGCPKASSKRTEISCRPKGEKLA